MSLRFSDFASLRTASSTNDPGELRVNLYRDNFEVSTQDAWTGVYGTRVFSW